MSLDNSYLPWYFFNEALHRDSQLAKEAFYDRSAFCKLVFHLNVEDICHQCHKCVFLLKGKHVNKLSQL